MVWEKHENNLLPIRRNVTTNCLTVHFPGGMNSGWVRKEPLLTQQLPLEGSDFASICCRKLVRGHSSTDIFLIKFYTKCFWKWNSSFVLFVVCFFFWIKILSCSQGTSFILAIISKGSSGTNLLHPQGVGIGSHNTLTHSVNLSVVTTPGCSRGGHLLATTGSFFLPHASARRMRNAIKIIHSCGAGGVTETESSVGTATQMHAYI